VESLRRPEVLGANVTVPYKETVLPFLDELDPLAREVGAVNTIVRQGDRLVAIIPMLRASYMRSARTAASIPGQASGVAGSRGCGASGKLCPS